MPLVTCEMLPLMYTYNPGNIFHGCAVWASCCRLEYLSRLLCLQFYPKVSTRPQHANTDTATSNGQESSRTSRADPCALVTRAKQELCDLALWFCHYWYMLDISESYHDRKHKCSHQVVKSLHTLTETLGESLS